MDCIIGNTKQLRKLIRLPFIVLRRRHAPVLSSPLLDLCRPTVWPRRINNVARTPTEGGSVLHGKQYIHNIVSLEAFIHGTAEMLKGEVNFGYLTVITHAVSLCICSCPFAR